MKIVVFSRDFRRREAKELAALLREHVDEEVILIWSRNCGRPIITKREKLKGRSW